MAVSAAERGYPKSKADKHMDESKSILIIEDEADLADVLGYNLRRAGYRTDTAADGHVGLQKATDERPDLIILDVMMEQPDDGFVVAQDLRRKGVKTPIVILSSIGHVTGYQYGKDSEVAPVDEFVSKPVAPAELVARVKALLKKRQA